MIRGAWMILLVLVGCVFDAEVRGQEAAARPNILWITSEDHGPHLGCYGDAYAHTPNLDTFAQNALRYDVVWSNAPVCAPARTAILTGMYPTRTGAQHMRSAVRVPSMIRAYPQLLREAGYYCTNNAKEDYNVIVEGTIWDESSSEAHYKNRAAGQPFFAVFNSGASHENRVRNRTALPHHDPADAPLPPYHPDTPESRRDWAQYYHSITRADADAGRLLRELEEAGLADDTIVFYYSDHGAGLPRHKRWPYNSGLHVALLVHVPDKFRHLAPAEYVPGGATARPVAFVDLAPTLLSLAGIGPPNWMDGQAFMGAHEDAPRQHVFGFRGRMDERYDLIRSVRDERYIYIRNYLPHYPYGRHLRTMFTIATLQDWHALHEQGALQPPRMYFWQPKPAEELYDLHADPHEVSNLIDSPEHQHVLAELRGVLRGHLLATRDVGLLPEAEKHRRANDAGLTIYEMAQRDEFYPTARVLETAELAAQRDAAALPRLIDAMGGDDAAVRYWAVTGILVRGEDALAAARPRVTALLHDDNPSVRIAAAEVLARHGSEDEAHAAVDMLASLAPADRNGAYVAMAAMNVITELDAAQIQRIAPILQNMQVRDPDAPGRANGYVQRLVQRAAALVQER